MFSPGLVNNLDNLAREGIIDFDATAFVTGTKPRYIGNPSYAQLPMPDMTGIDTGNLKQPSKDEIIYANPDKNWAASKNPLWKKLLFGGIAATLIVLGGKKLYKAKPFKNIKANFEKMFTDISNRLTGLFKKKTPAP